MKKKIWSVSDLKENLEEISSQIHETNEPVFLTKNGFADMVVLSMEAYENLQSESEVYFKLKEAEESTKLDGRVFSSKEVLNSIRDIV